MSLNRNFQRAKASKNDEFYTKLEDIERELRHYLYVLDGVENRIK